MPQPSKPTVRYTPSRFDYIEVGHSANVIPVDHTSPLVSNKTLVHTSEVIVKHPNGD